MFSKVLARFYVKWFQDCHDSALYCAAKGNLDGAKHYRESAARYLTLIMENWDAIEFFSVGDRAFTRDSALPVEFRGYK